MSEWDALFYSRGVTCSRNTKLTAINVYTFIVWIYASRKPLEPRIFFHVLATNMFTRILSNANTSHREVILTYTAPLLCSSEHSLFTIIKRMEAEWTRRRPYITMLASMATFWLTSVNESERECSQQRPPVSHSLPAPTLHDVSLCRFW